MSSTPGGNLIPKTLTEKLVEMLGNGAVAMYPLDNRPPPRNREEELERMLENAKEAVREQAEFIESLKKEPVAIGTVAKSTTGGGRGIVVGPGGIRMEVNLPGTCGVGTQVRMLMTTSQVLSAFPEPVVFGGIVTVTRVLEDSVTFSGGPNTLTALLSSELFSKRPEPGDRVQLDPTGTVALRNLGRDEDEYSAGAQSVPWDDIGGLTDAKEALREAIEYPVTHAELFAKYGKKASRGVLLYGPPGCGKTLLGKAAATALGDPAGFMYVKGAEVLSKWVGDSEASVRAIFDRARTYYRRTGRKAVVFIDEAEALLAPRGGAGPGHIGFAGSMTVPSFLAEMDGLEESGAFVILSTNRPNSIDPAIVRDGRIDRKIKVGRPDAASAEQVFRIAMRGRPMVEPDDLVREALAFMYSDELALYELLFEGSTPEFVCLRDMLTGAAIAGFIERATSRALHRERKGGEGSGITLDDVRESIRESFREMSDVLNLEALADKISTLGKVPNGFRKAAFHAGSKEAQFGPVLDFGGGAGVHTAGGGAPN